MEKLSPVGADGGCWGRVDLPFSSLPPVVAFDGHLQNKTKAQKHKSISSPLLFSWLVAGGSLSEGKKMGFVVG